MVRADKLGSRDWRDGDAREDESTKEEDAMQLVAIILGVRICTMVKKDASNFQVLYAAPKAQCSE